MEILIHRLEVKTLQEIIIYQYTLPIDPKKKPNHCDNSNSELINVLTINYRSELV